MSAVSQASDLERHVRDQYRNKTFVLRGFYSGERLRYDSAGTLVGGGAAGDWTTDGFVRVDDIHASGRTLKIKAKRFMVTSVGRTGLQLAGQDTSGKHKNQKKAATVEIEALIEGNNLTEEKVNAILSRILLTSQDSFVDTVPEFWKSCIADGQSGTNASCRFSSEMAAVPGVASSAAAVQAHASPSASEPTCPNPCDPSTANSSGLFRVGHGVKPPRAIYQPDPSFSEPARKAKYQGTMTLSLVVDKDGLPQHIHVMSPLGAGLDEKAVRAVETWKFHPAEKDGQPVAVQIAVEVDFRLY